MFEEPTRKPIPMKVKRQVYERAKGKCEKCRIPLEMNEGDFHHIRDSTVTPRASSIRFLCPLCHRRYGHKRFARYDDWTGTEVRTIPREVVKLRKKKPKTKKRIAIRNIWGDIIGYRTVKTRKRKKLKKLKERKKKRIRTRRKKRG